MKELKDDISEKIVFQMLDDTSQLLAKHNSEFLSSALLGTKESTNLTCSVEFWKWLDRNYKSSGIFSSSEAMKQKFSQSTGMRNVLQGKGYEWDWMLMQRNNPKNIFKKYDAGDFASRPGSDVTEMSFLTGKSQEFQLKGYTSSATPELKNTPKDMKVITTKEKIGAVKSKGYERVERFQDAKTVKKATDERLEQIDTGKATPTYNFKNVAGAMAKAGAIGAVVGMGIESVASYKSWKKGELTDTQYIFEVLKAGGDAGITAGITTGIMIPVSSVITIAGASNVWTIPIAFVISGAVNKIVAPCFGRGDYKKYLKEAKYYQQLNSCYEDFITSVGNSAQAFCSYIDALLQQEQQRSVLMEMSREMDDQLKKLYDEI